MTDSNNDESNPNRFREYRDNVLNKVSPTFCSAKWLQSTVTLYNGMTHSCHHPVQHKIDATNLKGNPQGLHNTPVKFVARADMLKGIQTPECNYCWNIENLPGDHLSDRTYKSAFQWANPHLEKVLASKLGENINPTYMEVAFESTCNFKCTYCSPDVSSRWMEEVQANGPYELTKFKVHDVNYLKQIGRFPIRHDEPNLYIDAFWEWWPELYQSLHTFRITGGEPLLSKHTWRVLDYIIENPRPDLTVAINTNMGVPRKLIDKLIEYSNKLVGKVARFTVYTSNESTGAASEYIRYGMNYQEFIDNCEYFLANTHHSVWLNFMITSNVLGAPTFRDFMQYLLELRGRHPSPDYQHRVRMMVSYIRWPHFLNLRILTDDLKERYSQEWLNWAHANSREALNDQDCSLFNEEVEQIERLVEFMNSQDDDLVTNRKDFALYHGQYDDRRKVNFDATFPELVPFMQTCFELMQ